VVLPASLPDDAAGSGRRLAFATLMHLAQARSKKGVGNLLDGH
jgi:hypothetical protein